MEKLFQKKNPEDLRNLRLIVYATADEAAQILNAARIRQMDRGEYMRRTALGRRADVDFETEIVLSLIDVSKRLRELHKAVKENGQNPPEEEWRPVIQQAIAAMVRISK